MGEEEKDHSVPEPAGAGITTKEQVEAIAKLIEAFIAPLMLLVPSRYKTEIQAALDKMKEVVDGNADSR